MKRCDELVFLVHSIPEVKGGIGRLVAISIPIFTLQLEKAREATDEAIIRSLYAECSAAVLTGSSDDTKITVNKDDSGEVTSATYTMTQKKDGLSSGTSVTIGGVEIKSDDFKTGTATITVNATGAPTITIGK